MLLFKTNLGSLPKSSYSIELWHGEQRGTEFDLIIFFGWVSSEKFKIIQVSNTLCIRGSFFSQKLSWSLIIQRFLIKREIEKNRRDLVVIGGFVAVSSRDVDPVWSYADSDPPN